MPDCSNTHTMSVVRDLALSLCGQIEINHLPEDMNETDLCLVPLYRARAIAALPKDVEDTIAKIERSVRSQPHYACGDCPAVFLQTDDFGLIFGSNVEPLEPGQPAPARRCPVCRSDMEAQPAKE